METTFEAFLEETGADDESLLQAMRFCLAELADYRSPAEMEEEIRAAADNRAALERELRHFEDDPKALAGAARTALGWAWEQPGGEERVRRALAGAGKQLPIFEVSVLAIVAMYGMYLLATGGVSEVEEGPDWRRVKYHLPGQALGAVVNLFRGAGDPRGRGPAEPSGE